MAQLWGGRFTKETDKLVYNFNASISFDQRFYEQDIQGSMAHVKMLCKQGIINEEEKEAILSGLESILNDVKNGTLEITDKYEDIHSFVEANLIDRIGDAGKKLRDWNKCQRVVNAVLNVMNCGFGKQRSWQRRENMIILQRL